MQWINLEEEERRRRDDELKRLREQTKTLQAELDKFRKWIEFFAVEAPVNIFLPEGMAEYLEAVRAERVRVSEEARRRAEAEKAARVKQLKAELAGMERRRGVVEKELAELCPQ